MVVYEEYSVEDAFGEFFTQTFTARSACDAKASQLVGGEVVPVDIQGVCSYTVYAGPKLEYVVQFRLKSLELKLETATLASKIYGPLVPRVDLHGLLEESDDRTDQKEPLLIYVMSRMPGISHLDYILANGYPENSKANFASRRNLMTDIARFMALTWKASQDVSIQYRETLRNKYASELQLLLSSLPERFQSIIQRCLDQLNLVFCLPMVLLHRDFGTSNILVDEKSCHLTGVIDWAEAEICPFGQNLHSLQDFTGALHLRDGWRRYEDYESLQEIFWHTFRAEFGGMWSEETRRAIHTARIMGLLLSRGFTKRLANMATPTPIQDDDSGRYNLLSLDGFLVNQATMFTEI